LTVVGWNERIAQVVDRVSHKAVELAVLIIEVVRVAEVAGRAALQLGLVCAENVAHRRKLARLCRGGGNRHRGIREQRAMGIRHCLLDDLDAITPPICRPRRCGPKLFGAGVVEGMRGVGARAEIPPQSDRVAHVQMEWPRGLPSHETRCHTRQTPERSGAHPDSIPARRGDGRGDVIVRDRVAEFCNENCNQKRRITALVSAFEGKYVTAYADGETADLVKSSQVN